MNKHNVSPFTPKRREEKKEKKGMDFGQAMRKVIQGHHVRREEWEDKKVRLALVEEKLMIFLTSDNRFHPLIVNAGDLHGEDWVVTKEN